MPPIISGIDPQAPSFAAERDRMLAALAEVRGLEARVRANSSKQADKFRKRGQLLPRERIARLLDPGAPWLELSTLAGLRMHDDDGADNAMGGGNIVGIGVVSGVRCLVGASDSAIKGGTVAPMGLRKSLRAQEIALVHRLPCVNLVESGGANLNYQADIFVDGGRVFANMARLSAEGIPQITIVHGSSTAGGAYLPGLSDYVIGVRGKARVFLAGPPLVKAALGEDADEESLGGAEMHATRTGTVEYLAENDAHAIDQCRELLAHLGRSGLKPQLPPERTFKPPRYSPEELCGAIPFDYRTPYDCRELIARMVDDSDFLEFKPGYGPQTVCGHAAIEGWPVGIIANNGPIWPDGSTKAAHFIQACGQAGIPLLYLQNITGYMVGTEAEQAGIVKHGSKMIQAVSNARVPQVTLVVGGSFGAGNYGMCGRSFDPRFIFAWPNARTSVMGPDQAARVLDIVARQKFERMGVVIDDVMQENLDKLRDETTKRIEAESMALFSTARLWDDGIIDPRDSRTVVALAFRLSREAQAKTLGASTYGVARM